MVRLRIAFAVAAALVTALVVSRLRAGAGVVTTYSPARGSDQVVLCTPAFSGGEGALGLNVASLQGLQIYTTLRKSDGERTFFGEALLKWGEAPLSALDHREAQRYAEQHGCRLVLWGEVHRYGDHVVVQSQLTMNHGKPEKVQPEAPLLLVPRHGPVRLRLPATRYTFTPIVLKHETAARYQRIDALPLHSKPFGKGRELGSVGSRFVALEASERAVRVRAGNKEGWLDLPELAENHSEASDFVAGILRVFRGDYAGAGKYLKAVLDNPSAGITVRADTYLYRAISQLQLGQPLAALLDIEQALKLDPYSAAAHRAAIFVRLTFEIANGKVAELRAAVAASEGIVPRDDAVLVAARARLSAK